MILRKLHASIPFAVTVVVILLATLSLTASRLPPLVTLVAGLAVLLAMILHGRRPRHTREP